MRREGQLMKLLVVSLFGLASCTAREWGKCHEYSGEDANVNLETAVSIFQNCLVTQVENFRHIIVSNTCHVGKLQIKDCENDVVDAVTNCKSQDKPYFPPALFNFINDYLDALCAKATHYKHYILLDHRTCFPTLSTAVACYNNFKFFNSSVTVTRKEMCNDQLEVKECLLQYVNNTCSNDTAFLENINRTMSETNFPCSASSKSIIVLLYFVMVLLCLL